MILPHDEDGSPVFASSFDGFLNDKAEEENNESEKKVVQPIISPPKQRRGQRRKGKLPSRFRNFVTDKTGTGEFAEYSMCMVSDNVTTPENNTILKEDPNVKAIPPDAYTPAVQQTFGIQPEKCGT